MCRGSCGICALHCVPGKANGPLSSVLVRSDERPPAAVAGSRALPGESSPCQCRGADQRAGQPRVPAYRRRAMRDLLPRRREGPRQRLPHPRVPRGCHGACARCHSSLTATRTHHRRSSCGNCKPELPLRRGTVMQAGGCCTSQPACASSAAGSKAPAVADFAACCCRLLTCGQ